LPSVISEDERGRKRERYAIAPVAHHVEYPGTNSTKSRQLRNDDAAPAPGWKYGGKPNGRMGMGGTGGKQARTFPVTLRYKESNSPGEIHVNVNAGSAVR